MMKNYPPAFFLGGGNDLSAKRPISRICITFLSKHTRGGSSRDRAEKALNHKAQGFLLKQILVFYVRLDYDSGDFFCLWG